jgi:hypothetical protein
VTAARNGAIASSSSIAVKMISDDRRPGRLADKRGSRAQLLWTKRWTSQPRRQDVLAVDDNAPCRNRPVRSRIVELRYFGGDLEEIAD